LLAGCAFGVRNATLLYPPKGAAPMAAQAQAAPAPPAKKTVQITLVTLVDQRTDKKAVGTMRNAFGMRTADVLATNGVTEWVTQAVKTELEKGGYTVVRAGAAPAGAGTVISGDVLNVFCDMYLSYTGQVSLLMRVRTDGTEWAPKHYAGEGSAGIAFAGTGESFAESLSLALAAALQKFVADLDAGLKAP
jgi:hypothetical protein